MTGALPLDRLPPPPAVAPEDFAALRDLALAELQRLAPDYEPRATDPAVRVVEVAVYLRLLLGGRINEAVRATWLATAGGADLDRVAAGMDVSRKPGEPDDGLRDRARLAWTALSAAGPRDAYRFHALSVPGVRDAAVRSPAPGRVAVTVLSDAPDGAAGPELVAAVEAALSDDRVRPVTDEVEVRAAALIAVDVDAVLRVPGDGPDPAVVEAAARAALDDLLGVPAVGRAVRRSAIVAALHVPGVESAVLAEPAADVDVDASSAAAAGAVRIALERA